MVRSLDGSAASLRMVASTVVRLTRAPLAISGWLCFPGLVVIHRTTLACAGGNL